MVARAKAIDTVPRFADWLNQEFDLVQSSENGNVDYAAILSNAQLVALRLGAGDLTGPITENVTKIATLAAIGRLLAWCRSQPDGELLWDESTAAKQLGMSARSLWSLRQSGNVPSMKVGRLVRYSPAVLRDWIAGNHALSA